MKSPNELSFLSIFLASPAIKLGDVNYNAKLILSEVAKHSETTNLFVFPELCLTSSTLGNYFLLDSFKSAISDAIFDILVCSYSFHTSIVLGTPLLINGRLVNCALFISDGKLIGIVPKDTEHPLFRQPNISSFTFNGYEVPISTNLIFNAKHKLGIIVGSPTIDKINRLLDADIVAIIDASPYSFNKDIATDISTFSKYTNQAILYANASECESSTDNMYSGEAIVSVCGQLICGENEQIRMQELAANITKSDKNDRFYDDNIFKFNTKYLKTEIDLDIICASKKRCPNNNKNTNTINLTRFDFIKKDFTSINCHKGDNTSIYADPFRTSNIKQNIDLANEILEVQAMALARRMKETNISSLVLGISGGVDSTLALLVAIRSSEILGLNKKQIHAISMPGLATSDLTNDITAKLCNALEANSEVISITESVKQHFQDINHNPNEMDVVFENSQARMRTMILFDYANKVNGIVLGTGDMSEIALGWNTFNGDHIGNYNVNCGIPKTVAIAMLHAFANFGNYSQAAAEQIKLVLQRPISPELIPENDKQEMQNTEKVIGPYELNDFFLYYFLKYYLSKDKIIYLASVVFGNTYSEAEVEHTFNIFWNRFIKNQYKRSCAPDGPAIFDISLSPRNGAIFPSDIGFINN